MARINQDRAMKTLALSVLIAIFLCLVTTPALSDEWDIERVNLRDCYGAENNPFHFENCNNRNIRIVGEYLGLAMRQCHGAEYNPFGFENCMNRAFGRIARTIPNTGIRRCFNLDAAPFNYEFCTRNNWRRTARALARETE